MNLHDLLQQVVALARREVEVPKVVDGGPVFDRVVVAELTLDLEDKLITSVG